mmetsp:Transcript_6037/g.25270  ORF Transcript_6037/g.25270 Transcript_6037/m.25270 type:complete len:288 (+) Transcript_6037:365-1228(+)
MLGAHVQNAPVGPPATSFVRSVVRTEALAIVAGYAGVEMLAELAQTSAALRVAMDRLAPEIFRAAAMAKFPVLRLQAPYLPDDTDWRRTYLRHAKLEDEGDDTEIRARAVVPTTTLDDYLFVAQVTRYARSTGDAVETFAYVLRGSHYRDFELTSGPVLAPSIFCDIDHERPGRQSKMPSILVTVMQKSTGKQAVLCHFRGARQAEENFIHYQTYLVCIFRRDIVAHLDKFVITDLSNYIGAEANLFCSAQELHFRFVRSRDPVVRGRDELSLQAGLVMLEHNVHFT